MIVYHKIEVASVGVMQKKPLLETYHVLNSGF